MGVRYRKNASDPWREIGVLRGPQGPAGPAGPQGERGFSGVAMETKGFVAFNITEDGVLQCSYTGDEAPDYYIDQNGHLILEV